MTREYMRCCGLGGRALKDLGGCVGVGYFRGRHRTVERNSSPHGLWMAFKTGNSTAEHACMRSGHGGAGTGVGMGSRLSSRSRKPCEMNEMQ